MNDQQGKKGNRKPSVMPFNLERPVTQRLYEVTHRADINACRFASNALREALDKLEAKLDGKLVTENTISGVFSDVLGGTE